jgi:hypothetical protein
MNIRQALLDEHSKHQTMAIVEYIGDDPARFAELMDVFFAGEYRTTQRAAWPLNYCAERNPRLICPYLDRLVDLLARKDVHNAVRRNIARLLQFIEIPEHLHGKVYSLCVDLVDNAEEPVAVRVFALTVAANIAKPEPDLTGELKLIVEKHLPHTTPAFRARARRILCI